MNNKVLDINEAIIIAKKLHAQNKKLVLVGGCFDIIHVGHIMFLTEAKKQGDALMILVESDDSIKNSKGNNRPINVLEDRVLILANLINTDYIVSLPLIRSDAEYDKVIYDLKPDIIATTAADPGRHHKKRQAKNLKIRVVDVLDRIETQSTSKIAKLLKKEM